MARRSSRIYVNALPVSDPSTTRTMTEYAINLVNSVDMNEKILTLGLDYLPVRRREQFIERLYCINSASCGEEQLDRYNSAAEDLENPSSLSSTIIRHIYRKYCNFTSADIKRNLLPLLLEEYKKYNNSQLEIESRLLEIGSIFNLTVTDIKVLKLCYYAFAVSIDPLYNIFNGISYSDFTRLVSITTGLTATEIKKSLKTSGNLVSTRIIESIDHTRNSFISLDDAIAEYLAGISEKNIVETYVKQDRQKVLKPGNFSIPEDDTNIIRDILNTGQPCNIILYGKAGTGKTEYARSLAAQCSDKVYHLRYGEYITGNRGSRGRSSDSRIIALRVAINTVSSNGGILIADEADFLLNTISWFFDSSSPEKGWLNDLLDNSKARIIWITNHIGEMEESTLRRFSYSLCFKSFDKEQRISVWNNQLKGKPYKKFISRELITELSGKYEVNAGAIASSLNALGQIHASKNLEARQVKPLLENLLTKHSVLLNADIKKRNRLVELTDKYDLSFLNTDTDITSVVSSAKRFNELNKQNSSMNSMNLLLWGESGTGKTEFAKYLASQTGMGLIIKRASDLKDMWVGNTEKYIRQAFREAEEKKSILFIDEADTFFSSRESAIRSWEVSQTNEFLVQMENFNGILICCTNLLEIFDTAAMRRFNWKVRFSPVLSAMRVLLYEKYFVEGLSPLTQKQKKRISSIEMLTPGHVKTVSQRRFFEADEIPDHDSIIDEVEREASYMKIRSPKKVGF